MSAPGGVYSGGAPGLGGVPGPVGGVPGLGDVCPWGGVCSQGGCLLLGEGGPGWGCVSAPGGWVSGTPPCEQNYRHL